MNLYLLSDYFRICAVLTHQNLNWVAYLVEKSAFVTLRAESASKSNICFFAIHNRYLWCMKKIGNIRANVALEEVYVASLLSHSKNWLGHSSKIELRRLSLSKEKNNWDLMVCSKHKMALKKWLLVCCRWQEEASVFPITPHYRTACLSLNKLTRKFETNYCANSTNCAKTTRCKWRALSGQFLSLP